MYKSALFACTPACQKAALDPINDDCEPLCGCWEFNSEISGRAASVLHC